MNAARRLLGPAIATALTLACLIWLGVWQLHRLAWKTALLDQIAAAERAPPVPLNATTPGAYARVTVTGTWAALPIAAYGAAVEGERMGADRLAVLDRAGTDPLLVDLGWAADGAPIRPPSGTATLVGYVRPAARPGLLAAADDDTTRRFFTLDPARIGRAIGAPRLAPFTLVLLSKAWPDAPLPAPGLPQPPNNHLQYALTWFGLGGALLAVFGAYAGGVLRAARSAPTDH